MKIEGKIVNSKGVNRKCIEIDVKNGLISNVSEPNKGADIILNDELIFPGFIDIHTHCRECTDHREDYKEDFKTAGEAGINGGVVAIADMPNNPTPPIDDISYEEKKSLASRSPIDVILYAGIGPNTKPLSLIVPYKAFMGPSVGDLFFRSSEELEENIKNYESRFISFHCEDPKILEENKSDISHEKKRPVLAETEAIDFALYLIKKYNLKGKICHCSTKEGIEKIIKARENGVNVTIEVTPHHLYFDTSMLSPENEKWLQVNPPIREDIANRLFLLDCLKRGIIDYLATDHAPHTKEEKEKGMSGMPHLDTYAPFVTWLMKEHNFSPSDIVRVCSENPASFVNNFSEQKYGKIEKGYVGSLTILDLEKPITITEEKLKTKCRWSPFAGTTFPGSVKMTVIKGNVYRINDMQD